MPIMVVCACGKQLRIPDRAAGKTVRCPGCQATVNVPAPAPPESPPTPGVQATPPPPTPASVKAAPPPPTPAKANSTPVPPAPGPVWPPVSRIPPKPAGGGSKILPRPNLINPEEAPTPGQPSKRPTVSGSKPVPGPPPRLLDLDDEPPLSQSRVGPPKPPPKGRPSQIVDEADTGSPAARPKRPGREPIDLTDEDVVPPPRRPRPDRKNASDPPQKKRSQLFKLLIVAGVLMFGCCTLTGGIGGYIWYTSDSQNSAVYGRWTPDTELGVPIPKDFQNIWMEFQEQDNRFVLSAGGMEMIGTWSQSSKSSADTNEYKITFTEVRVGGMTNSIPKDEKMAKGGFLIKILDKDHIEVAPSDTPNEKVRMKRVVGK